MAKTQLTKQLFGVPSIETAGRIDDSDKVSAFEAARFRCHGLRAAARERQAETHWCIVPGLLVRTFSALSADFSRTSLHRSPSKSGEHTAYRSATACRHIA